MINIFLVSCVQGCNPCGLLTSAFAECRDKPRQIWGLHTLGDGAIEYMGAPEFVYAFLYTVIAVWKKDLAVRLVHCKSSDDEQPSSGGEGWADSPDCIPMLLKHISFIKEFPTYVKSESPLFWIERIFKFSNGALQNCFASLVFVLATGRRSKLWKAIYSLL